MEFLINHVGNYFELTRKGDSRSLMTADWWLNWGKYKAEVYDKNGALQYSIRKKVNIWKLSLTLTIVDNKGQKFVMKNMNRRHTIHQLRCLNDTYEVRLHKGRKQSIFKNNVQIAALEEPFMNTFNTDKIQIFWNGEGSVDVIFLMVVCLKIGQNNQGTVTFDFGNIGKIEPMDESWKP